MKINYTAEERQRLTIAHLQDAQVCLDNAWDLMVSNDLPGATGVSIPGLHKQIERLKRAAKSAAGYRYFSLMHELKALMRADRKEVTI